MTIVVRRVLRVHLGEVNYWIAQAGALACPEIEEREDVAPGTYRVYIERHLRESPAQIALILALQDGSPAKVSLQADIASLQPEVH